MRSTTQVGAVLVAVSIAAAGCGGEKESASEGGAPARGAEVVITCEACPIKPTDDPFQRYRKELTDAFNAKYKGRYRVDAKPYTPANDADAAQHYQRAAVTDTLPDVFAEQATIVRDAARTGKLVDFAPVLDADRAWKGSFKPGAFASLSADDHVWASRSSAIRSASTTTGRSSGVPAWPSSRGRGTSCWRRARA